MNLYVIMLDRETLGSYVFKMVTSSFSTAQTYAQDLINECGDDTVKIIKMSFEDFKTFDDNKFYGPLDNFDVIKTYT